MLDALNGDSSFFSENDITGISNAGISFATGCFIDFTECACNYKIAKEGAAIA